MHSDENFFVKIFTSNNIIYREYMVGIDVSKNVVARKFLAQIFFNANCGIRIVP